MEKKTQKPTLEELKELTETEDENLRKVAKEVEQRVAERENQEKTPLPQTGWKD